MADQATGNGPINPAQTGTPSQTGTPQTGDAAQLVVNAQYIKDLSFENPRAPQSLMHQGAPPSVEINVDVKGQNIAPDTFEVVLTINASATSQGEPLFIMELVYGAVVTARNIPQDALPSVVLVETPRMMFPFARNIVAEATRDGGFPPLMINPIDFAELLRRNQEAGPETATA